MPGTRPWSSRLSSKLSGTYQSAVTAAADFDGIYVVDSKNVTIGQGILVQYALELAEENYPAQTIAEALEDDAVERHLPARPSRHARVPQARRPHSQERGHHRRAACRSSRSWASRTARSSCWARRAAPKNGRNQLHQQVGKRGIEFGMPVLLGYTGLSDALLRKYLNDNRAIWEDKVAEDELPICSVGAAIGTHVGPRRHCTGLLWQELSRASADGARGVPSHPVARDRRLRPPVTLPLSRDDAHDEGNELVDGHGFFLGGPRADDGENP